MSVQENKALIKRFLASGNAGERDEETTWACFDPECTFPSLAARTNREHCGLEEYKAFLRGYYRAVPDATFTPERVVADGDEVWARITIRGTHQGELRGVPATGNPIEYTQIGMYTVRDGKIVESNALFDELTLMRQLSASAS